MSFLLYAVTTAAIGGLLFGFDIAIITGAGPYLKQYFHLSNIGLGWAFSSLLFGCVAGSAVAGKLADRFGRKPVLFWVAALFGVTSLLTGLANSFVLFIAARCLGGVAVGGVSIVSPLYIAEVSPAKSRGKFGALYQMSVVTGILLSYLINYSLRNAGVESWRWMFISGIVPAVLLFALLIRAPESPRYLIMRKRQTHARGILQRLLKSDSVEDDVEQIVASCTNARHGILDLVRPGIRRAVGVACCLAVLIHLSGVNTVIDYAPVIFQSAGWQIDAALFATFLVGVTNFVFTFVSFWVIDRWGRKPLYILGSTGMALTLLCLSLLSVFNGFHGRLVPLLVMVYLALFASCIGPVFWTLMPEMFPNYIRGTAMTAPVLTQWVTNAMVVLLFPFAFAQLGTGATFGFLSAMCLLQAFFTWRYVPETKGRTLEEMESLWMRFAKQADNRLG